MYEVELYHHGIKGQKWGVRRFQDYDGKSIGGSSTLRIKRLRSKVDKLNKKSEDYYYSKYKPSVEDERGGLKESSSTNRYSRKLSKINQQLGKAQDRLKTAEEKNDAKAYKKALNNIDQGLSEERRDASDSFRSTVVYYNAANKFGSKSDKALSKGNQQKADKYMAKAMDYMRRATSEATSLSEHKKNIQHGQDLTKRLIEEASSKNYNVTSRRFNRNVSQLSDFNTIVYDPQGIKYNVRRNK